MPRTSFGIGTPANSEFLNKVARPKISNEDDDGNIPLLNNSAFVATPGSVVFDFYNYADAFRTIIAPSGGLNIFVRSATFLMPDNTAQNFAAVTVAVPNNAITFVWRDIGGVLRLTSTAPTFGVQSAIVTTSSGVITSIVDSRFDFIISPQVSSIQVFGGVATNDITLSPGVNVLGGLVECRNFTCPPGATIQVNRSLTIRASGSVTISGNVTTQPNLNPVVVAAAQIGGGNISANFIINPSIDSLGRSLRSRQKCSPFPGFIFMTMTGNTLAANTAAFVNFSAEILATRQAISGGDFTINCAGRLTISPSVLIDMSAIRPATPVAYLSSDFIISPHPTSGLSNPNFTIGQKIGSPQGVAGTIVLQSTQVVDIQANSILRCNGANEGFGYSRVFNSGTGLAAPLLPLGNEAEKNGGGGGGGIWIQSPTILSAVSATYTVLAGTTGTFSASNLYLPGVGSVGNGWLSNASPAQNGSITSTIGFPTEF